MSKQERNAAQSAAPDDDEPDEWDKRIFSTGCAGGLLRDLGAPHPLTVADENMKLTDCYFEKKDWRKCTEEMATFKKCWKLQGNDQRTSSKDA
ncbi:hypothetical protein BN1708_006965 [Verticillium longisporum]|uniref:CHCH domain-containing protein n=1 Tax=Verticillium longisporum TaxID=100787 RepID=A0A0G4MPN7_VERLO|nr:hypothetical protein BN1708_006965 [Verticillium longisporum]